MKTGDKDLLKSLSSVVRSNAAKSLWEKTIVDHLKGGKPLEKICHWEHLISKDKAVVLGALSGTGQITQHVDSRKVFLRKLASLIPLAHERGLLLEHFLKTLDWGKDDGLLTVLVQYYPLSVMMINRAVTPIFSAALEKEKGAGEDDIGLLKWLQPYIYHVFKDCDLGTKYALLEWLLSFSYRAIHEFLLTVASSLEPSKPEDWIFFYKLLLSVSPEKKTLFVSPNRYASVLFSTAAAVPPGVPVTPGMFLSASPTLLSNISLTPGLAGLIALLILKNPSREMFTFAETAVSKFDNLNLLGLWIYPLVALGCNIPDLREEMPILFKAILSKTPEEVYPDDYCEVCIKCESTLLGLKLGQVVSHVSKSGSDAVADQLTNMPLSPYLAIILCHCLVLHGAKSDDNLLYALRNTTDDTTLEMLTFTRIHKNYFTGQKLYYVYLKNISSLANKTSLPILKKIVRYCLDLIQDDPRIRHLVYHVLCEIWEEHGGAVYSELLSLLNRPRMLDMDREQKLELNTVISDVVRTICCSDRQVNHEDMKSLINRYLEESSTSSQITAMSLQALTFLCQGGTDVREVLELVKSVHSRNCGDILVEQAVCLFYAECLYSPDPDLILEAIAQLWEFSQSPDSKTAGIACEGLTSIDLLDQLIDDELLNKVNFLISRGDIPAQTSGLLTGILTAELQVNPARQKGTGPNPSKKLLNVVQIRDVPSAEVYDLDLALFSFVPRSAGNPRKQLKEKSNGYKTMLDHLLMNYKPNFTEACRGMIVIEGWCQFITDFITTVHLQAMSGTNTKNKSNVNPVEQKKVVMERLLNVRKEIKERINELGVTDMAINVLLTCGTVFGVHQFACANNLTDDIIKWTEEDIGVLNTLAACPTRSESAQTTKTVILLSIAFLGNIADTTNDFLVPMLLDTCIKIKASGLVEECAALATGTLVHIHYKKYPCCQKIIKGTQKLLDNHLYLGACFCVDAILNAIGKPAVKLYLEDFIIPVNENDKQLVHPSHFYFLSLLHVQCLYTGIVQPEQVDDYISFLSGKMDGAQTDPQTEEVMLKSLCILLYFIAPLYPNSSRWELCYKKMLDKLLSSTVPTPTLPMLSLLSGFPFTSLVDTFNSTPPFDSIIRFADHVEENKDQTELLIMGALLGKKLEGVTAPLVYKVTQGSVWECIQQSLMRGIEIPNPKLVGCLLKSIGNTPYNLPFGNPQNVLQMVLARVGAQVEVIECAALQANRNSDMMNVLLKLLRISVFPQLTLSAQRALITQAPKFLMLMSENDRSYFFTHFLLKVFWKGDTVLQLDIIVLYTTLHQSDSQKHDHYIVSFIKHCFEQNEIQTSSIDVIKKISGLMISLDILELPRRHHIVATHIVQECVLSDYKSISAVTYLFKNCLKQAINEPLMKRLVHIISLIPLNDAYTIILEAMYFIKQSMEKAPGGNSHLQIFCLNCIPLAYTANVKCNIDSSHKKESTSFLTHDNNSISAGVYSLLFMGIFFEPQVNSECMVRHLKNREPWTKIINMFNELFSM